MKLLIRLSLLVPVLFLLSFSAYAQAGYAINFQNLDYMSHGDFIYCGAPSYSFANKLTVAAWVKWTTDASTFATTPSNHENEGQYSTYVAYAAHNANSLTDEPGQFWLRNWKNSNKFQFSVRTTNGTVTVEAVSGSSVNTWVHIAGVYDGSTIYLYVNGVLEKSAAQTGNIISNDGTYRLSMGRSPWGYGFFVGHMDELRIWKAALTQSDVQAQMNTTISVKSDSLASYWNFNAGSGTTIDDSGPVNADGVFYSALIDVHSGSDFANRIIADNDKTWTTNYWAGMPLKTVSGAGIDETNTVSSNTANTMTVQYGFNAASPNNRTTPIVDSKSWGNDTWFGVEKSGETSQWVVSDAILPVELTGFGGTCTAGRVVLKWTTISETHNAGFAIERAVTGLSAGIWERIGFVQGAGNSNTPRQYSFSCDQKAGERCVYRLQQMDNDGSMHACGTVEVQADYPQQFLLLRGYPNPFNPSTAIEYQLSRAETIRLAVYDMLGNEVRVLAAGPQNAGFHTIRFDGSNLPAGLYLVRLQAAGESRVCPVMLVK